MATELEKKKWALHQERAKDFLLFGLEIGKINIYDDELIEKLRTVYYGCLPASILLLTNYLTNGHCYDRSLLMAQAFLDSEDDVQLVYASIDSLKLNPEYIDNDNPLYADHCFVERITKDGKHLIYDPTSGFIYDKDIYWEMEHPQVRKINDKASVIEFLKEEQEIDEDKSIATLIIPMIENSYGMSNELYSQEGIELLQREVELFKKEINYVDVWKELDKEMKRKGIKK